METFEFKNKVEKFSGKGGWFYVEAPPVVTKNLSHKIVWGLIPINAKVGKTTWKTSLMPMGDGSHFVALNSIVRKKEGIEMGKTVKITFTLR
jgi:hypothetical protein